MDSNCLDSDVQRCRIARSHSAANDQTAMLAEWLAQCAGASHESSPVGMRTMRAVMRILSNPTIGIGELAGAESLSRRQLERDFARCLGTSPRHLADVVRVHAVSRLARCGESLASAAAGAGFADQSHMSRAVRRLTGLTPKHFVRGQVLTVSEYLVWGTMPASEGESVGNTTTVPAAERPT
jgi:AraC-like DNA-binding protein